MEQSAPEEDQVADLLRAVRTLPRDHVLWTSDHPDPLGRGTLQPAREEEEEGEEEEGTYREPEEGGRHGETLEDSSFASQQPLDEPSLQQPADHEDDDAYGPSAEVATPPSRGFLAPSVTTVDGGPSHGSLSFSSGVQDEDDAESEGPPQLNWGIEPDE